jgi:hypothetical protein
MYHFLLKQISVNYERLIVVGRSVLSIAANNDHGANKLFSRTLFTNAVTLEHLGMKSE